MKKVPGTFLLKDGLQKCCGCLSFAEARMALVKKVPGTFFALGLLALSTLGFGPQNSQSTLIPRIHFNTNSSAILESEQELLSQNVSWFKQNPSAVLILEGHCDEWGEAGYNLQLGDLRAREVKAYLMEQGIDAERMIMVVSFGEQRPIDPRSTREAWKANRRVEFVLR